MGRLTRYWIVLTATSDDRLIFLDDILGDGFKAITHNEGEGYPLHTHLCSRRRELIRFAPRL